MLRVPYEELLAALNKATLQLGLEGDRAALCASLFAETTRDGVYTHGLNRFPRFAAWIHNGSVIPTAEPERIAGTAVLERWMGILAPGTSLRTPSEMPLPMPSLPTFNKPRQSTRQNRLVTTASRAYGSANKTCASEFRSIPMSGKVSVINMQSGERPLAVPEMHPTLRTETCLNCLL